MTENIEVMQHISIEKYNYTNVQIQNVPLRTPAAHVYHGPNQKSFC